MSESKNQEKMQNNEEKESPEIIHENNSKKAVRKSV